MNEASRRKIRASLDEAIKLYKEDESASLHRSITSTNIELANETRKSGWKNKLVTEVGVPTHGFDLSPQLWIWNDGLASKFLTTQRIEKLNQHLDMVKYLPKTEQEFKYLQLNLMIDAIDQYIAELKAKSLDRETMRKLASLRVFRKNFET